MLGRVRTLLRSFRISPSRAPRSPMRNRALFLVGMLVIAGVSSLWLSSFFALMLMGLDTGLTSFTLYIDYLQHLQSPEYAPFVGKIKAGGLLGFGMPGLVWLAMTALVLKPRAKALHGDAKFASAGELASKGLFKDADRGVVVGRHGGKLMKLDGQQFAILAAPTRSGKGVGVVIPNLLEYRESVVVLDIKQENFDLTSGWRKSQGQEVFLFNPSPRTAVRIVGIRCATSRTIRRSACRT